jgi:hypothetical protein
MNAEPFDRLSRTMGAATSRRGLLGAFAGGIAAVLLGRSAAAPAAAAAVLCNSDAECSAYERCLSGYCVASTAGGPVGASLPPQSPSDCCRLCDRRLEGWINGCQSAPNRENCYGVYQQRYQECKAACPQPCR